MFLICSLLNHSFSHFTENPVVKGGDGKIQVIPDRKSHIHIAISQSFPLPRLDSGAKMLHIGFIDIKSARSTASAAKVATKTEGAAGGKNSTSQGCKAA